MNHPLLRGLRLPVVNAPMFLVSGPELVIASCCAGIIGSFPTHNARPIEALDTWMGTITERLEQARLENPAKRIAPWAVSLVTHRSNARLEHDLALIAKYRPPIVITALGSPKPAVDVARSYGALLLADVVNLALARKAVAAGVDGLVCVSTGAGGHTGSISPFAFVRAVRAFFDGIVVLGGAIADGHSVAGAIAAGADLAAIGTRFIATHESLAAPRYKEMLVDGSIDDLVVSKALTGASANWLKPSLVAAGLDPLELPEAPAAGYDMNRAATRKWVDTWSAGQGLGSIQRVDSVADVVDELAAGYREATGRLRELAA